jgi:CopG family transcriptional regulator / antitoxin EndoAI
MSTNTLKRVNITIPQTTLEQIDALTERGDRSKFIDQAVHFYVKAVGRKNLRQALKEGAVHNSLRDTDLTAQWFHVEESVWQNKK